MNAMERLAKVRTRIAALASELTLLDGQRIAAAELAATDPSKAGGWDAAKAKADRARELLADLRTVEIQLIEEAELEARKAEADAQYAEQQERQEQAAEQASHPLNAQSVYYRSLMGSSEFAELAGRVGEDSAASRITQWSSELLMWVVPDNLVRYGNGVDEPMYLIVDEQGYAAWIRQHTRTLVYFPNAVKDEIATRKERKRQAAAQPPIERMSLQQVTVDPAHLASTM